MVRRKKWYLQTDAMAAIPYPLVSGAINLFADQGWKTEQVVFIGHINVEPRIAQPGKVPMTTLPVYGLIISKTFNKPVPMPEHPVIDLGALQNDGKEKPKGDSKIIT